MDPGPAVSLSGDAAIVLDYEDGGLRLDLPLFGEYGDVTAHLANEDGDGAQHQQLEYNQVINVLHGEGCFSTETVVKQDRTVTEADKVFSDLQDDQHGR